MSKESLGDLAKIQLSRRALLAGGLGFVALACTPSSPEIRPDVADGNQLSKVPPTPVAAKEIDPLAPINIDIKDVRYVYSDEISEAERKDIASGQNIPLPFSQSSFPITIARLDRRIIAKDPLYGDWIGREIKDSVLGFMLPEGSEVVAFTKGRVVLQPTQSSDPYLANTVRIEFRPDDNDSRVYVYAIGGKNIELLSDIKSFPEPYIRVEAGQPLVRILKPARVPAPYLPDIVSNIPGTYNLLLTQQSTIRGNNNFSSIFREQAGIVTSSQLSVSSLAKDGDKFVGLYSPGGK